jgi:PAS domain S-box-containing protein
VGVNDRRKDDADELTSQIQALQSSPVLLDAIPVPVFYKNAGGVYLGCNKAFERYLGRCREDIVGHTVYDIAPKPLADVDQAQDEELLARGGVQRYESRVRYADGTEHDVIFYKATFAVDGKLGGLVGSVLDISERKRAEEALREREQQLSEAVAFNEHVIAAASVGISVYDSVGKCVLANDAAARAVGAARQALLQQNFHALESWRNSGLLTAAEEALRTGESRTLSIHVKSSFDKDVWLDCRLIPFSSHGERHLLLMFDDVSERKRMEQALRASEARYRRQAEEMETIYQRAPIGLAVFDREGRFKRVNERLAQINGLPVEAHLGKTLREVIPFMAEECEALAQRVFATGEAVLDYELRGETAAHPGVKRFWNEHWLPLKDDAGQVWGINVVVEDVTERKRMEAIRRREQEFRTLVERSPDVVARYDRDLRYVYISPAIEKVTGKPPSFYAGKRIQDLPLPAATKALWVERLRRVFETGTEAAMAYSLEGPDGNVCHFDTLLIPESAADGSVEMVIATSRDVTRHKRTEAELRNAYASLEQTIEALRATQEQVIQSEKFSALGTLAAGIAHELNNPLMGVMGYVGLTQRKVTDPGLQEMMRRAGEELVRMRDLLTNMLAFAHPIEEDVVPIDPGHVIDNAVALMRPAMKALGVEIVIELAADLPTIAAKEGALQQVFVNLLMNARDALQGCTTRRVVISGRREGGSVLIAVTDTGPGIPQELVDRIFDPFVTTKRPGRGTGLGLSVARSILADLGGRLTVQSHADQGACFQVELPVHRSPSSRS